MEYLPSYMDSLYLAHHGIKGQHWGVRRFQNENGTRTAAGKRRQKKWADTFNKAAQRAEDFSKFASSNAKEYAKNRAKQLKQDKDYLEEDFSAKKSNKTIDENIRISKRQENRYKKLAEKYKNVDWDSISKKDYKDAKKFTKSYFHDAPYAWVSDNYNYEDHD